MFRTHITARHPMIPGLLALMLVVALLFSSVPLMAEQLVVFQSHGVALKPGDTVESGKPFILKAGEWASLIAPNGRILKLHGPHDKQPLPSGEKHSGVVDSLKKLVSGDETSDDTLGVSRSATAVLQSAGRHGWVPEPWVIDVTRSGHQCAQDGTPVVFWRANKEKVGMLQVRIPDLRWEGRTQWPMGADKLATPPKMPKRDGLVYYTALDRAKARFMLHMVPGSVEAKGAQAAWLMKKGCRSQALALLRGIK